ncbi:Crp/Fnr family transcriptional regulator [Alteromonas sp. 1_MG-2023]|uniref:Crp/Fnr family transcriptional regulator n=1 Tax=unclassified Alteromonas TaxID=2614992 RepID=UPI0026E2BD00|nr:Crp/Fnr family transcriptional regulator [Alteromonas sp. 1_MG-2023]MDO6475215.1 Crp/Fnr family transcriptional regulator [Alteromonas sp. 1_MG-2023]
MSTIFIPKHIRPVHSQPAYSGSVLFNDMTPNELEQLDMCAEQTKCGSGEYLFRQHDRSVNVFNVISGTVSIERVSNNGRRQILGFLFPGDFVGVTSSPCYDYAVRSLTKAEFYRFNRKKLYDLAEEMPHLKTNLTEINSRILNRTIDQLYILGQKKAHERLCFLFMHLLERLPGARPDRIELYMTRQDIADFLGLTTETVSRSLAKLKQDKLIAVPSLNHLQILDMEAVSEMAST